MAAQISPKAVNLEFNSGLIPGCMRLSPFATLCSPKMSLGTRMFLMEACNAHGSDMSIAYEKGRQKKDSKRTEIKYDVVSIASDQWSFVEIAADSPVPTEDVKKEILIKLNLNQYFDDLVKVVKNYRAITQKKKIEEVACLSQAEFEKGLSDYISS
jgi:hypothetical protein